jgi:hypothetical protein
LKAVGQEQRLRATATNCFRFGGLKKCPTHTVSALRLVDPKMLNVAAPAPGMAAYRGNNACGLVFDDAGERPPVAETP